MIARSGTLDLNEMLRGNTRSVGDSTTNTRRVECDGSGKDSGEEAVREHVCECVSARRFFERWRMR